MSTSGAASIQRQPAPTQVERFWLARAEITEAEYDACVKARACTRPASGDRCGGQGALPVNCVSHAQARTYCAASGARLPTEAEWELAARGLEERIFAWGDDWSDEKFGMDRLPVGSCRTRDTPTGIHDLAGNGREWTSTGEGDVRISKGMECASAFACVAFNRFHQLATEQLPYLGFRCARSEPPPARTAFIHSASPATAHRTVHWSSLIDSFPVARGPVRQRTTCSVDVRFDASGRATTATALGTARPGMPACPAPLRVPAEAAVRELVIAPHEGGVDTTLPVAVEP